MYLEGEKAGWVQAEEQAESLTLSHVLYDGWEQGYFLGPSDDRHRSDVGFLSGNMKKSKLDEHAQTYIFLISTREYD